METNTTEGMLDLQKIADSLSAGKVSNVAEKTHASDQDTFTKEENLGVFGYFTKCLKNYANFKGRARRKEFWSFILFNVLVGALFAVFEIFIMGVRYDTQGPVRLMYSLAVFLPGLAVGVRRLHDIGKSGWSYLVISILSTGWNYLVIFIPLAGWSYFFIVNFILAIGGILLLVWCCRDSQPGTNKYGLPPKATPIRKRVTNSAEGTRMPGVSNAIPAASRINTEEETDTFNKQEMENSMTSNRSAMLDFVCNSFRRLFILLLWLNVIGWTLAGLITGASLASMQRSPGNKIACLVLGVFVGLIIGVVTTIVFGGIVATFLNIDQNLQKIAEKQK